MMPNCYCPQANYAGFVIATILWVGGYITYRFIRYGYVFRKRQN